MVQEVDRKSEGGRTIYEVEIRREGKNKHIRVDGDGKLLPRSDEQRGSATIDFDADNGGQILDKNDGKILGVIDNSKRNDGLEAEVRVGDNGVRVESDIEKPRDRGLTEDIFDKNDGKILDVLPVPEKQSKLETEVDVDHDADLNAEVRVDTDKDDARAEAEVNEGRGKGIFRKGDGKILGIPIPGRNRAESEVSVDITRDEITTDANGGLDTDKNDGRILGVPKRGFETLSLNDIPPVVRETIRREAGGYKIAEIERATLDGRTVYEVDIERDGRNRELHIAANGNVLKDSDREAAGTPAGRESGRETEQGTQR